MKKFLAMLMAIMMLLTVTAAFAEDATAQGKFTKKFVGALPVDETLSFTATFVKELVSGSTEAPDTALITIADLPVDTDADGVLDVPFTVTQPTAYGSYVYKITENKGNNENITYDEGAIFVMVNYLVKDGVATLETTLCSDPNGAAPAAEDTNNDTKNDQFVNTYTTDSFTVSKSIKGNAANKADKFVVEVSFTAAANLENLNMTYISNAEGATETAVGIVKLEANKATTKQITIGDNEIITFSNVPKGVTVKINELKQSDKENLNSYTPSYTNQEITIDGAEGVQAMSITNTKDIQIPTGVYVDYIPYVVLLAVAVLGLVAFVVKRRMAANNDD